MDTAMQINEYKNLTLHTTIRSHAIPVPNMEPDARYMTKEFARMPKSGLMARPNHLGDGIVQKLPKGF